MGTFEFLFTFFKIPIVHNMNTADNIHYCYIFSGNFSGVAR